MGGAVGLGLGSGLETRATSPSGPRERSRWKGLSRDEMVRQTWVRVGVGVRVRVRVRVGARARVRVRVRVRW